MTPDTHDTVKKAHKTLRRLFLGEKSPYEHASQVETAFFDWEESSDHDIELREVNQDAIRGFDSLSEEAAEAVLKFAEEEHPEVLEA